MTGKRALYRRKPCTKTPCSVLYLVGIYNIILVHNHPSGDVTPSEEDMKIYKKLHEAGQMLDIPLVEFMVVADGFYSFQEHKELLE